MEATDPKIIDRLLEVVENEVVPLTQAGVRQENKVFGTTSSYF